MHFKSAPRPTSYGSNQANEIPFPSIPPKSNIKSHTLDATDGERTSVSFPGGKSRVAISDSQQDHGNTNLQKKESKVTRIHRQISQNNKRKENKYDDEKEDDHQDSDKKSLSMSSRSSVC